MEMLVDVKDWMTQKFIT